MWVVFLGVTDHVHKRGKQKKGDRFCLAKQLSFFLDIIIELVYDIKQVSLSQEPQWAVM